MDHQTTDWLDQLDLIDPFFGDQAALSTLRDTAPTQELAAWLSQQMLDNKNFAAKLQEA